jgi:hypothetical protein
MGSEIYATKRYIHQLLLEILEKLTEVGKDFQGFIP